MSDMNDQPEVTEAVEPAEVVAEAEPAEPLEPAEPIESRFLFVDVAAQRANQLRRGARIRIGHEEDRHLPHKLERVAMEEVRRQLVHYSVPEPPVARAAND
jgi:DNA-directed RNA polymerase subunit K/omega